MLGWFSALAGKLSPQFEFVKIVKFGTHIKNQHNEILLIRDGIAGQIAKSCMYIIVLFSFYLVLHKIGNLVVRFASKAHCCPNVAFMPIGVQCADQPATAPALPRVRPECPRLLVNEGRDRQ
jgi:hypothetical protein